MKVAIYDTTLRDGVQGEGIHYSVADKLAITELLDDLGVAYIEGGWPGSNPKDEAYFSRVNTLKLQHARIAAFGSTRRAKTPCEKDGNIQTLLQAETGVITLFGKASKFQAIHALKIEPQENFDIIEESIRYVSARTDEVIFDAEHFFDGYFSDPQYAIDIVECAKSAGASYVVLCDTNGGTLPKDLEQAVLNVKEKVDIPLGIHTHNDSDLAVANSLIAVDAGITMVQGTINGYGERCGNANLVSIIPAIELKKGNRSCLPPGKLQKLCHVSHTVDEISNRLPLANQPYVGRSAFAHKGGVHANAVMKNRKTYEHIDPKSVGNMNRILVSDLSGAANICLKAREFGFDLDPRDEPAQKVLRRVKHLESTGYEFEGAEASFKLLLHRSMENRPPYFVLHDLDVRVDIHNHQPENQGLEESARARIKLEVGDVVAEARATGDGPVHAIDQTLRKLIDKFYPCLKHVYLMDYKVRVLTIGEGTASVVRVLVRSGDGTETWGTVGVSHNIIEASWYALVDAMEYKLIRDNTPPYL